MIRRGLLCLVAILLCAAGSAGAQRPSRRAAPRDHSPAPYLITGTVVSSVDQNPVAHCRLTASLNTRSSRGYSGFGGPYSGGGGDTFYCDEHGHFSISLSSAGSWRLTASARGFVTQAYEQHDGFSSAIVLTAAKPSIDLRFRLSPEASITGVVVDEAGEPIRNAQVTLQAIPTAQPDGTQPVGSGGVASGARTDDRGIYELIQIRPGQYRLNVRAQIWYANTAQPRQGSDNSAPIDPSLDFVYPITWFPGSDDPARAEVLTLRAGDERQADFRLAPIPSIHLRVVLPANVSTAENGRPTQFFPMVQQITGGFQAPVPVMIRTDAQGQMDIGGLAPGTYQVRAAGPNNAGLSSTVEVTSGAVRTVDFNASSDQAKVTIHVEGVSDSDSESRPIQVNLIDPETGHIVGEPFRGDAGGFRRARADSDRTLEATPGRYEVVLQGRPNVYLTGITAKGAEVVGRFITFPSGASTLTVHVANGRAKLSGIASLEDKPLPEAMALLVPTTLEEPGSLRTLVRDQTNTDGSFEMDDVIPGQYILVVIDRGWEINWSDRATLLRYLPQGVPLDLSQGANVKQNVVALAP